MSNGIPFPTKYHLCCLRPAPLNRRRSLANDVDDEVRLGEHGDMAAVGLDRGRVHALRQKSLKIHSAARRGADCFVAEPVIGPRIRADPLAPRDDENLYDFTAPAVRPPTM